MCFDACWTGCVHEACRVIRFGSPIADEAVSIPKDSEVHAASLCREHAPAATLYKLQTWAVQDSPKSRKLNISGPRDMSSCLALDWLLKLERNNLTIWICKHDIVMSAMLPANIRSNCRGNMVCH